MFHQLSVITKKEFASYFRSPTAYIIIAVYLVISMFATFYSGYFFAYDNSGLVSFFTYQPEIFVVLTPAVTMRLWADERRSGTMEFLLTQPLNYSTVVIAKFLAACLFCWAMLLLTLPFVFYAANLIPLDKMNVFSGYLGVVLVIAYLCALGCLVSVFNTNAVLAYLFSVFVGWLLTSFSFDFLLTPLLNFSETITNRLSQSLNFYRNYQDMIMGQPGIDNLTYFLSFTLLVLWLNVAAIDYKKL